MSYILPTRSFGVEPVPSDQAITQHSTPTWVVPVVVVSLVGLIGVAIYSHFKIQQQIIHEKGVGAALGYQAGMTGIGLLGDYIRPRRNGKKRRTTIRSRRR